MPFWVSHCCSAAVSVLADEAEELAAGEAGAGDGAWDELPQPPRKTAAQKTQEFLYQDQIAPNRGLRHPPYLPPMPYEGVLQWR